MKKIFLTLLILSACGGMLSAKVYTLQSPDKLVRVEINVAKDITYSVYAGKKTVLAPSPVLMQLPGEMLGRDSKVRKTTANSHNETIAAPLYRQKEITARYNSRTFSMDGGWGLEFRAYDNGGVAYRFFTEKDAGIIVENEIVQFNFDKDYNAWYPYSNNKDYLLMSFENVYEYTPLSEYDPEKMAFLPVLVDLGDGSKVFITESDVESYPGMYVRGQKAEGKYGFEAVFPKYPAGDYTYTEYRVQERVGNRENYIANVEGRRTFPWRIIRYVGDDRQLPIDDMVYMTATPNRIGDVSWVQGGRSAWDWWNNWGLSGVDFKAGINTETYKYYTDFCADNGLEFFILDEGWSPRTGGDVMKTLPEIDLKEIIDYANSKNIKVFLWVVANVLDDKLEEACRTYSQMGFAGFKVDFIDRQDQLAVERIYRISEMAAKYKMTVNFHGMYKPTGLNRTYPNVINYEGVWGLEQLKWTAKDKADMPEYDVTVPFIRMAAGPMDYTQGAMRNAVKGNYQSIYSEPMSQGTRAHQVATYVVFDSPMVMLCDAPTNYLKEKETLDYIAAIPAVFDRMEIPLGKVGEYIVTAREKDGIWYVGGLTGWDARILELDFGFLGNGEYQAEIFMDGINAGKVASDYRIEDKVVTKESKLEFQMASGGGFAVIIRPKK